MTQHWCVANIPHLQVGPYLSCHRRVTNCFEDKSAQVTTSVLLTSRTFGHKRICDVWSQT